MDEFSSKSCGVIARLENLTISVATVPFGIWSATSGSFG
jgi:hypothetical protein